jgi:hypothetical protein
MECSQEKRAGRKDDDGVLVTEETRLNECRATTSGEQRGHRRDRAAMDDTMDDMM